MFGVDVPNLNLGIQINPIKQPTQSNSVGSWHVSHCWTPAFDYHPNHGFTLSSKTHNIAPNREGLTLDETWSRLFGSRSACAWLEFCFSCGLCCSATSFPVTPDLWICWLGLVKNEILQSLSSKDQAWEFRPCVNLHARNLISASVELCEIDVCFLHIQLVGTNVWLPKMHKSHLMLILSLHSESSKSPAKSESCNNPNLHCCALLSTWHFCVNSLVWWM